MQNMQQTRKNIDWLEHAQMKSMEYVHVFVDLENAHRNQ